MLDHRTKEQLRMREQVVRALEQQDAEDVRLAAENEYQCSLWDQLNRRAGYNAGYGEGYAACCVQRRFERRQVIWLRSFLWGFAACILLQVVALLVMAEISSR